ncbi:MAG: HAD family phosphatase [Muribaculaceae bacterium]|nr:HAD family phosphatase [Muribaculaceae bacterium]
MKNLKDIKAFLFDLDGVLIDSESEYTKIWNAIEQQFPTGIDNFPIVIKGTTLEDILSTYFMDKETRKKVEKELYRLEKAMKYTYSPGARQLLLNLKEKNIPVALVTSSNSDKMKHLYNDIPEFSSFFDAIIVGEMVEHSKPNPEGYLKAAALLGINPEECVVVEDSLQGIKAGRNSGATVIGIAGTLPEEVLRPEADVLFNNIQELADYAAASL